MDISSLSSVTSSFFSGSNQKANPDFQSKNPALQDVANVTNSVTSEDAKKAVDQVNQVVSLLNRDVEFSVDKNTGIHVVSVVDKGSKEVIRQLPLDAVIRFAQTLDTIKGLLFRDQA